MGPGSVHRFSEQPGRRVHGHARELELNLLLRGGCRYLVDGQRIDLAPGHLLWLPPGRSHLLIDADPGSELLVAMVDLPRLRRRCPEAPLAEMLAPTAAPARLLAREQARALGALLRTAADHPGAARRAAALVLAVLQGWEDFAAAAAGAGATAVHPAVARAAALLAGDPGLERAALVRACGLSAPALGRAFRRALGLDLTAYRQRCRLDRFLDLRAANPGRTLLWCALAAGFGSYAQFHRVHTRLLGRPPRAG